MVSDVVVHFSLAQLALAWIFIALEMYIDIE